MSELLRDQHYSLDPPKSKKQFSKKRNDWFCCACLGKPNRKAVRTIPSICEGTPTYTLASNLHPRSLLLEDDLCGNATLQDFFNTSDTSFVELLKRHEGSVDRVGNVEQHIQLVHSHVLEALQNSTEESVRQRLTAAQDELTAVLSELRLLSQSEELRTSISNRKDLVSDESRAQLMSKDPRFENMTTLSTAGSNLDQTSCAISTLQHNEGILDRVQRREETIPQNSPSHEPQRFLNPERGGRMKSSLNIVLGVKNSNDFNMQKALIAKAMHIRQLEDRVRWLENALRQKESELEQFSK